MTIFTQSCPGTFKDCSLEGGPRAPQGETLLCRPNKRTIGDGGGLRSPDQDGRDLWGSAGVCGGLRGSVWPHTLRHSETLSWGPPGSPSSGH